jgi:hypothetical protein
VSRPEPGRPWRVAFVGQEHYFGVCSPRRPSRAIDPAFVDHRGGGDAELMLARVRAHRPHVVIVFRPEIVPPGLFAGLDALTLGWNTEPLPRAGLPSHRDLDFRLTELLQTDPLNFDRLISFEPVSAPSAEPRLRFWRSLPLPVADEVYAPLRPMGRQPRVAFVGYSTAHRERWLIEVKHRFDVLHLVHGVTGDRLLDFYRRIDVAINLHVHEYPQFENRVALHLAAGHLLLSEPLSPLHGLEPDVDFLEVRGPKQLEWAVEGLMLRPVADRNAVRVRGRRKAEHFRASRVYPRLVADLAADVATFGSPRR